MSNRFNLGDTGAFLNGVHRRIHNGQFFIASEQNTLSNGASRDYLILTGSLEPHLAFQIDISHDTQIQFLKQVTESGVGSVIPTFNAKDPSSISNTSIIHTGSTLSDPGSVWENIIALGGAAGEDGAIASNAVSRLEEFILNTSDKYAVRLTNLTSSTSTYTIRIGWYETKHND